MNLWHWLFGPNSAFGKLFGKRPTPAPTPVPTPTPARFLAFWTSLPNVSLTLRDANGTAVDSGVTNGDGWYGNTFPTTLTTMVITATADGYQDYTQTLDVSRKALRDIHFTTDAAADETSLSIPPLTRKGRTGRVHQDGTRAVADDVGRFCPLGTTLMWALRGWRYDQGRVKQNLDFIFKTHHYDYVRILGEVGWSGNDISPDAWGNEWDQALAGLLDYVYDTCGGRTEITLIGGGTHTDYVRLAQRLVSVVRGREQTVMDIEIANEAFQNLPDANLRKQLIDIVRNGLPTVLVAESSGNGDDSVNFAKASIVRNATLGCAHPDRAFGDGGWRAVRQAWDWKDLNFPVTFNEPIGPRASVAECTDPLQLAMLRATALVCGVSMFVFHNGAGVAGQVDPAHARPANLWEVPNIDAMMQAVRNVDAGIDLRVFDGKHYNSGWAGNPFTPVTIWPDTPDHGVNRAYLVTLPDGFVCTLDGIKDHVDMKVTNACRVDLFDPVVGSIVQTLTFGAGQTLTITPNSRDTGGLGGFITRGTNL